jgi:hypothetical protein
MDYWQFPGTTDYNKLTKSQKTMYDDLAKPYGISGQDYLNLLTQYPPQQATKSGLQSGVSQGQYGLDPNMAQGLQTLKFLNSVAGTQGGLGQSQQQGSPAGTTVQKTGAAGPANALNLLGAQALSRVGLNPSNTMTVNPTPGSGMGSSDFAKSGVSAVSSPTTYDISGQPTPKTTYPSLFSPMAISDQPATASQIKSGISDIPAWQSWYNKNLGDTIYVNGVQRTIASGTEAKPPQNAITPDELYGSWSNASWTAPKPAQYQQAPAPTQAPPITPAPQATGAQFSPGQAFAAPPAAPGAPPAAQQVPIAATPPSFDFASLLPKNQPSGLSVRPATPGEYGSMDYMRGLTQGPTPTQTPMKL